MRFTQELITAVESYTFACMKLNKVCADPRFSEAVWTQQIEDADVVRSKAHNRLIEVYKAFLEGIDDNDYYHFLNYNYPADDRYKVAQFAQYVIEVT